MFALPLVGARAPYTGTVFFQFDDVIVQTRPLYGNSNDSVEPFDSLDMALTSIALVAFEYCVDTSVVNSFSMTFLFLYLAFSTTDRRLHSSMPGAEIKHLQRLGAFVIWIIGSLAPSPRLRRGSEARSHSEGWI